jgi:hypothetical protein
MAGRRKFRHQDIAAVPRGWKVRTVKEKGHDIRIAYPPGPRRKGAGRLISILHPVSERNPGPSCIDAYETGMLEAGVPEAGSPSYTELEQAIGELVLSSLAEGTNESGATANPDLKKYWSEFKQKAGRFYRCLLGDKKKAETVEALPADAIENPARRRSSARQAAKLGSGKRFRMLVKEIERQGGAISPRAVAAAAGRKKYGKQEMARLSARGRRKKNPAEIGEAKVLYKRFSGAPSGKVTEIDVPAKARDDYAHLGWVQWLGFVPPYQRGNAAGQCPEMSETFADSMEQHNDINRAMRQVAAQFEVRLVWFNVEGDEIRLAASPKGNQLYLLGGRQTRLRQNLDLFKTDASRDRVDLGELVMIVYTAEKRHLGSDSEEPYYHWFAEERGEPPQAYFDAINGSIGLTGGDYSLDEAERGIIN